MTDPDLEIMRLPLGDSTCPGGGYMVRPYKGQKTDWRYLCDETTEPRQIMVNGSTLQNLLKAQSENTGPYRLQKQSETGLLPGEYLNSRVIQCGEDPDFPNGGVIVEGQLGQTNFSVMNACPGCMQSEKKILNTASMKGTPVKVNGKKYMKYQNAKGIIMKPLNDAVSDPSDPHWESRDEEERSRNF